MEYGEGRMLQNYHFSEFPREQIFTGEIIAKEEKNWDLSSRGDLKSYGQNGHYWPRWKGNISEKPKVFGAKYPLTSHLRVSGDLCKKQPMSWQFANFHRMKKSFFHPESRIWEAQNIMSEFTKLSFVYYNKIVSYPEEGVSCLLRQFLSIWSQWHCFQMKDTCFSLLVESKRTENHQARSFLVVLWLKIYFHCHWKWPNRQQLGWISRGLCWWGVSLKRL